MGTCIQVLLRCELLLTLLDVHACCVCLFFCLSSFCMCAAKCVYHLGSEFQDAGGRSMEHSGSPTLQHSHSDLSPHHSLDSASMSPVFANYLQQQQVQIQRQLSRAHLHCPVLVTSDMTSVLHQSICMPIHCANLQPYMLLRICASAVSEQCCHTYHNWKEHMGI